MTKVQSQQVFKRGLFSGKTNGNNSPLSHSKQSIKHGKPSHKEVTMAKLEVFKKKIEMEEDMGSLVPRN